jgi:sRNA-binding regulator protein Hfq
MGDPPSPYWGRDQAAFLAGLQDKPVAIAFLDGKGFRGTLVGVDPYNLFVQSNGREVMVPKHAIRYIHAAED